MGVRPILLPITIATTTFLKKTMNTLNEDLNYLAENHPSFVLIHVPDAIKFDVYFYSFIRAIVQRDEKEETYTSYLLFNTRKVTDTDFSTDAIGTYREDSLESALNKTYSAIKQLGASLASDDF